MINGRYNAWSLADIKHMLKAEEREREEREEQMADPQSRLLQEAIMIAPPSPEETDFIDSLLSGEPYVEGEVFTEHPAYDPYVEE